MSDQDAGMRLDRFLFKKAGDLMTHALVSKLTRKGLIRIDGQKCDINTRLCEGQEVLLKIELISRATSERPQKRIVVSEETLASFRSWILFEDRDCLVINKPSGIAVQGGTNIKMHLDAILQHLGEETGTTFKLVHRLDRETSGLLVFAKHDKAARYFGEAFKNRTIRKEYLALVVGRPEHLSGEIKCYMAKDPSERMIRVMDKKEGKFSHTIYREYDHAGPFSLLLFEPCTGRTHQLRLHASLLETPILGDFKYGCSRETFEDTALPKQLYLHAWQMHITLPSGKSHTFKAPLPSHFEKAFDYLGIVL